MNFIYLIGNIKLHIYLILKLLILLYYIHILVQQLLILKLKILQKKQWLVQLLKLEHYLEMKKCFFFMNGGIQVMKEWMNLIMTLLILRYLQKM
mmetsp:Transcript_8182/g.23378  ORF Transcript_8182/g.23378 Transcript_8182/m.23378 type:complete len:94 (+) Transcript_8182:872-1153(+)